MKLDLEALKTVFAADRRVVLAMLFGSARDGWVREGGDVDIAVLNAPVLTPTEFYAFYLDLSDRLRWIPELDLVDLNRANSILAFEALCGRRLFVRDLDRVAAFSSLVARQYEDDMLHAAAYQDT